MEIPGLLMYAAHFLLEEYLHITTDSVWLKIFSSHSLLPKNISKIKIPFGTKYATKYKKVY